MGKNKRKRSLDTSSSSKSGNVSLNIPEEEKLHIEKKPDTQQTNQDILSTTTETTSSKSGLSQNTENITEIENENTSEGISGNHISEFVEDTRNFIYTSCENLRSKNIAEGKCDQFESYYESMARRRSRSLENRPDWMIDLVAEGKFVGTNILREVPSQKNQDQLCETGFKEDKRHSRAHPKKKFKMSSYTNPVFYGFHDLNKAEREFLNHSENRIDAENGVINSHSASKVVANVVANVASTIVDPNTVTANAIATHVAFANTVDANVSVANFVPFTDPVNVLIDEGHGAVLDADIVRFDCNQRMDLVEGGEECVVNNTDRNLIADVVPNCTENTRAIIVNNSCDDYSNDVSIIQTTSIKSTQKHTNIHNTRYKTIVVENSSYKNIPSISRTNHLGRNNTISLEKQKTIDEMMNRTIYLKSGRRELINFFKSKPYQLKKEITQIVGDEVERIQMVEDGLRILTRTINQRNKLLNLTELGGTSVTASLPFALSRKREVKARPALKAVIYGLKENQDNLDQIASSLGLKSLKPLGNPQTSNTTLITFTDESEIPPHIIINGRFFKTWPFVPRPRRCNNCQAFDHSTLFCKNPTICSKCSGSHNYLECPNMNTPKCANCCQPHSAAYKQCTKYLEVQQVLKEKASQKPLFSDVLKRGLDKQIGVELEDQIPVKMNQTIVEFDAPNSFSQVNVPNYEDQVVNNFLDFNRGNFKAVIKSEPLSTSENHKISVGKAITFTQGVIAMLDKNMTVPEMRTMLIKSANQYLFKGKIFLSSKYQ